MNNDLKSFKTLNFRPSGIHTPTAARVTSKDLPKNLPEEGIGGSSGRLQRRTNAAKAKHLPGQLLIIPKGLVSFIITGK